MLKTVEGVFRDGKIELLEPAPQQQDGRVMVTFLPATAAPEQPVVVAFDTGPGNLLIDEAARLLSSGARSYDLVGRLNGVHTANALIYTRPGAGKRVADYYASLERES